MSKESGLMTTGNVYKKIALFALPLLLGNFFQLMYNTIDSVVVGNYVGKAALAAVGASTPIINLLIAFFQGLATGAGVVVSRYFGARKVNEESAAIHTFLLFSILFGIALLLFGYFMSPMILKWIGTQSDYYNDAEAYLSIYFLGSIFLTVYNAGTGILQAVGDSKNPLYFLMATSVLNIFLDLFFVHNLNMGVAGAAWATIISEAVSMFLVLFVLLGTKKEYKVSISKLRMDKEILKKIVEIGVPAGVQGMIVSFSNLIVMAYINRFGSSGVAGYSCANKIDNFLGLPVNSLMLAITTFCGQNLGAKEFKRVKEGVRASLVMSIGIVVSLGVIVFTFSNSIIQIFSPDPDVIKNGTIILRIMCPFYIFLCFHQMYSGALRASGRSSIPMITSIASFVIARQIYLAIIIPTSTDISVIGWGYSWTWVLAASLTSIYYFSSNWLKLEEKKAGYEEKK